TMSSLSLNAWKGLAMTIFSVLSVLGFAAAIVMRERAMQVFVSSGVLFSAGILIAGGFCHLLVDANEAFSEDLDITNFVWAFAISGGTVVCLACVEMALGSIVTRIADKSQDECDVANEPAACAALQVQSSRQDQQNGEETKLEEEPETAKEDAIKSTQHTEVDPEIAFLDHADKINPWVAILLTLALSIHSILEGIGIGATDDPETFESAFIAISVHKFFTAYALGNSLVCAGYWERGNRFGFYLQGGIFIIITLVGIGIGWAASSAASDNVASAVLVAITAGSFIFVGAMEVGPTEMHTIQRKKLNPSFPIFFFLAGYCLMALLALWA
ncbi:MAG: hypothetical protein SGILL_010322, partial [Bacillariaceae sp.]